MTGGLWAVSVGFRLRCRYRYHFSNCLCFGYVTTVVAIVIVYRSFLRLYRTKTLRVSISNPSYFVLLQCVCSSDAVVAPYLKKSPLWLWPMVASRGVSGHRPISFARNVYRTRATEVSHAVAKLTILWIDHEIGGVHSWRICMLLVCAFLLCGQVWDNTFHCKLLKQNGQ